MKTIIAGLALEGDDDPVVARAVQLARQHGARLILAHVIEAMPADADPILDAGAAGVVLARAANEHLGRIAAGSATGVAPQVVVAEGKPFEMVIKLMREEKADLVVIGPGKARTMREKLFGSTADRIVRSASVPVLVVRSGSTTPYRSVVVAADLSPQSLSASGAARSLAPEAKIEHIHVVETPLAFEQALLRSGTTAAEIERYRRDRLATARGRLKDALARAGGTGPLKLRIIHGDARKILARQARSRRTDLIALGTHGRNAISQMLLGSVARTVLHAATCDVLVVPC